MLTCNAINIVLENVAIIWKSWILEEKNEYSRFYIIILVMAFKSIDTCPLEWIWKGPKFKSVISMQQSATFVKYCT